MTIPKKESPISIDSRITNNSKLLSANSSSKFYNLSWALSNFATCQFFQVKENSYKNFKLNELGHLSLTRNVCSKQFVGFT